MCSAYARSLFRRPAPKRLPTAVVVFATTLRDVDHHVLLVGQAEARLFALEGEAWANLSFVLTYAPLFQPTGNRRGQTGELLYATNYRLARGEIPDETNYVRNPERICIGKSMPYYGSFTSVSLTDLTQQKKNTATDAVDVNTTSTTSPWQVPLDNDVWHLFDPFVGGTPRASATAKFLQQKMENSA